MMIQYDAPQAPQPPQQVAPQQYQVPQYPQSMPPNQPNDGRFRWWLVPINLLPGLMLLITTYINSPEFLYEPFGMYILPDLVGLTIMIMNALLPIAVGIVNMMMTTKALHFNVLQLLLLVATVAANELCTQFWLTYVSNDPGSSIVGFAATLGYVIVIATITVIGNVVLHNRAKRMGAEGVNR